MYYYGYNQMNPMPYNYVGQTNGSSWGAALWIVLFILLVIIIGTSWNNFAV